MRIRALLFVATGVMASVIAAACSGGSNGGSASSPTPTPTQTAQNPDSCQIVWISPDGTNPDLDDEYIVDAPLADWTSGPLTYAVNAPIGVFYDNLDPMTLIAQSAAITTSGTFTVTLGNGTTPGGSVSFDDSTNQIFYSLDVMTGTVGGKVGSNGTGTFTGVWSDPKPATPVGGNGNIVIFWQGSSLNIGGLGKYAQCYHASALSRLDRIHEAAVRALHP